MASKVGATVTSLEVVNSIFSSTLRSMPSAMVDMRGFVNRDVGVAGGGQMLGGGGGGGVDKKVWSSGNLASQGLGVKALTRRRPLYFLRASLAAGHQQPPPPKV